VTANLEQSGQRAGQFSVDAPASPSTFAAPLTKPTTF
jgi:hypothetical protein